MDSEAAQLRVVDGLVPAEGSGMYASDLGTRQRKPGGGGRRLVAEDAEEPGPDERASAPGRIGHRRGNGNGHPAGDRSWIGRIPVMLRCISHLNSSTHANEQQYGQ